MGLGDRIRQLCEEWADTRVPDWPKPAPPRDYGTCNQRGCTEPANGQHGLCNTHSATT